MQPDNLFISKHVASKELTIAPPSVGIIILNHEKAELTIECLNSILAGEVWEEFKIYLVDNGSSLPQKEQLRKFSIGKPVQLIDLPINTGFCEGTNAGTKMAIADGFKYVLWLNNDTIVEYSTISTLANRAEELGGAAGVTGKIYYDNIDKTIWYAGGRLSLILGIGKHIGFREKDKTVYNCTKKVAYYTGCMILLPAEVITRVGFLNESFFAYLEDTEYSIRLKKNGIPIWYEPKAQIIHKVGAGQKIAEYSPLYLYLSTRNRPHITKNPVYMFYLIILTLLMTLVKSVAILCSNARKKVLKLKALSMGIRDIFVPGKAPRAGYEWMTEDKPNA